MTKPLKWYPVIKFLLSSGWGRTRFHPDHCP